MRSRTTSGFRGYAPAGHDALARSRDVRTPPDLCEFFAVNRFDDPEAARRAGLRQGRELFFSPNIWPRSPAGFRAAFEAYYAAMENLADQLIRLMALALGLEEDGSRAKSVSMSQISRSITTLPCQHRLNPDNCGAAHIRIGGA
ncbi:MAG: hypothetical protein CM1200mP20_14090 [Pseudomonadota bacterium]|nr:MAG: hypothetical protein CM1200mP20_14090 [Pseudomonadota bacterium]